jgi:prepilin-type processing-associated H-X9-DG protein
MSRSARAVEGFTVVELLVVIGVIATLLAILLPVLASARETARTNVCTGQARQLIVAMTTFAKDHKGQLPSNRALTSATEHVTWRSRFLSEGYMDSAKAFICPSHPSNPFGGPLSEQGNIDRQTTCVGDTASSYAVNGHILWRNKTTSFTSDRADVAIDRPSHTALIVESAGGVPDMRVIDEIVALDFNGRGFYGFWHAGKGTYSFYDGHVETIGFLTTGERDCRWHNGKDLSADPVDGQEPQELGQHGHPDWVYLVPSVYAGK